MKIKDIYKYILRYSAENNSYLWGAAYYAAISRSEFVDQNVINLIRNIRNESDMLLNDSEAYLIYNSVKMADKIKGDLAEVGIYRGGSAKLIREANGTKPLHLFDTFEGIPHTDFVDEKKYYKGQFSASFEGVKYYLRNYENLNFYKGKFPDTSGPVNDKIFSFVNLDVDTYRSTLSCLQFFYPRMNSGGIIISHDYISAEGVTRAINEFFRDKPEPIIQPGLFNRQCIVVKSQKMLPGSTTSKEGKDA